MSSSPTFQLISSAPLKLLIFCFILASYPIKTSSIAMSGCHTKCIDSNIPYSVGMFVVAPLLVSTWIVWSQHNKKLNHHRMSLFNRNGGNTLKKKLSKRRRSDLKIYKAEEMRIATNDYSYSRSVLERCNPGKFYRGTLENREVVVMKIPAPVPAKVEQFVEEVIFLSQPHNNLVRVLGCCLETSLPLVVYELHGGGNCTLSDCMSSAVSLPQFSALKAAAEAARGLAYLLRSRKPRFVHGNVCSGNVFLDHSFDAKLFYAAGSGSGLDSDPDNRDVYGFGVVLREVVAFVRALDESDEVMMRLREVDAMAERCLRLSVRSEERPTVTQLEAKLTKWTQT